MIDNKGIILFDGICNLCNSAVDFIIKRDNRDYFHFTSLQSDIGQSLMKKYNIGIKDFNSIILIENDKVYYRSTASLRITRKLSSIWKFFYIFIIIPPVIRNFIYDIIAKYRYKIFGIRQSCRLPLPEEKSKFLN